MFQDNKLLTHLKGFPLSRECQWGTLLPQVHRVSRAQAPKHLEVVALLQARLRCSAGSGLLRHTRDTGFIDMYALHCVLWPPLSFVVVVVVVLFCFQDRFSL